MIKNNLRHFVERVMDAGKLSADDLRELRQNILEHGLMCREEADVLIALDRALTEVAPGWSDWLVASVVDFTVWTARPTGYVEQEAARWLVTSLTCGGGPTANAIRIACEIVRESEQVDEALLVFVMASAKGREHMGAARRLFDMAA